MDRQQVIAKIRSMLQLQESTDFEGEAAAAAHLIDKLCRQYGITVEDACKAQIEHEVFKTGLKISVSDSILLDAVASFYDAYAYVSSVRRGEKKLTVIGSEAQRIQTQLYYEYLTEVMERECDKAHKAERIMAEITGGRISKGFKSNFRKGFALKVSARLKELKAQETHPDAKEAALAVSTIKFGKSRKVSVVGYGVREGVDSGSEVSLHKQAGSSQHGTMALAAS
jgi:hypothetical protein